MTVEQQDLFLEHPEFDAQGRLPFQYTTLFEYQQDDPQLLMYQQQTHNNIMLKTWEVMNLFVATMSNITISV